jgi:hypothetical protein
LKTDIFETTVQTCDTFFKTFAKRQTFIDTTTSNRIIAVEQTTNISHRKAGSASVSVSPKSR